MIITMFGKPKFLHKMLPVKNLDEQTTAILSSIKLAGGNVVATVLDGNRVNQAFFKMFDTISPWRTKEGMFLLFDLVHLMENIRNSWITEETQEIDFCVHRIKKAAKWSDIRKLHQLEANELAKMSKLTEISVDPKPISDKKCPQY